MMRNWIAINFLKLLILSLVLYDNVNINQSHFADQVNSCETSMLNVIQNMFQNEFQALLNPRFRSQNSGRVRFDLYTPLNPFNAQEIRANDVNGLRRSHFNPEWPTRFTVHGWTGKGTSCSNAALKDAYLSDGSQYNVIIVDWSLLASDICYPRMSKSLIEIASQIAKLIRLLQREKGVKARDIYLIGHSAGCHVCGLTGKLMGNKERLGAIVALDPAGLVQLELPPKYRLAPTDALYVESIHTQIRFLGNPNFDLSHASIFANWGLGQPHCPNATGTEFDFVCDHFAALYYYAESIRRPKSFGLLQLPDQGKCLRNYNCSCPNGGRKCPADNYMSSDPVIPKRGIFYLSTRSQHPFGWGSTIRIRRVQEPTYYEYRSSSSSRSSNPSSSSILN